MEDKLKSECREKCASIFASTLKDPKQWFADNMLEITTKGNLVTVLTGYGGPTEWWTFNTTAHKGRYYYHYGRVQCFKNFGRKTYEKLMAFVG